MKGRILFDVLWKMALGTVLTFDVFSAIIRSPYGSSAGRMIRTMEKLQQETYDSYYETQLRRRYRQLIYKLRKEGLIDKNVRTGAFSLTAKGRERLQKLRECLAGFLPRSYVKTETTKELKIIAFDIPEKERRKRDWLRGVLSELGFSMLQKSVWIGKAGVPREFIDDLKRLEILSYVQILAITKSGTLKEVV